MKPIIEALELLIKQAATIGVHVSKNRHSVEVPLHTNKEEYDPHYKNENYEEEIHLGIAKIINNIFINFTLNQSSKEKSEIVLNNYCLGGIVPKYLKDRGLIIPNLDDNSMHKFYASINKWLELYAFQQGKNFHKRRFRFLVGMKGCGKTTFINYFLTRYHKELSDLNIIGIRINAFDVPQGMSIYTALMSKELKIIFNYCRSDSDFVKFNFNKDYFWSKVMSNPAVNKRGKKEVLEDLQLLMDLYVSENIKNKIPFLDDRYFYLYNLVKVFLKIENKDIKFLYFLDNFDRFGVGQFSHRKLLTKLKELDDIIKNDDFSGGNFIIVSRYTTYMELMGHIDYDVENYTICVPTIEELINRRIESIEDKITEEDKSFLEVYIRIVGSGLIYVERGDETLRLLSFKDSLNALEKFCNYDRRMLLLIINNYINYYLRDKSIISFEGFLTQIVSIENQITGGGLSEIEKNQKIVDIDSILERNTYPYREILLIDHHGWAYNNYSYKKQKKNYNRIFSDDYYRNSDTDSLSNSEFLPNLFSYPHVSATEDEANFVPIIKIRILQYLYNNKKASNGIDTIKIETCQKILKAVFGYSPNLVYLCIEELISCEVITFGNEDEKGEGIVITKRGAFILDNFVHRLNYLCICYESVAFPTFMLAHEFFHCANYFDTRNFVKHNKILGTTVFLGFLIGIEEIEERDYLAYKNIGGTEKKDFPIFCDCDFSLFKGKSKSSVFEGIEKIMGFFRKDEDFIEDINLNICILTEKLARFTKTID